MRIIKLYFLCCLVLFTGRYAAAQLQPLSLTTLDAFRDPGKNWSVVGDISIDYSGKMKTKEQVGTGVIMNYYTPKNESHLITKQEWGDMELEFEFMMFKNSNSGVYLQGRYEVQLYDSWKKLNPAWYDVGAIYSRYHEGYSYEGTQPVMNVAKAPGLWQKLQIRFRAPRFNEKGEKTENARFESVYLNGVKVINEVEVTGCTRACIFPEEKPTGPLVFQGDHGPVAFRNIKYGPLVTPPPAERNIWDLNSAFWKMEVNRLIVTPAAKPEIIRTFLKYGDTAFTHVMSIGAANQLNYSYDVKQGTIFQFWRGQFLDVTPAWWDRGWMQLGIPMGAVITLPNAPIAATLSGEQAEWPGALEFDAMRNKGYVLDASGHPTFKYAYGQLDIDDKIDFIASGEGITRTLTIRGAGAGTYCRLAASAEKIEKLSNTLYAIGDKSYYIQVDKKLKPLIRQTAGGYELLAKYADAPINYTMIW